MRIRTSCALFSIKQRASCGTVYTFFIDWVVYHFIFTKNTLLFTEVKVFWHKTRNTVDIIPKSSRRTLTDVIKQLLSSFAGLTFFRGLIPESVFRTDSASVSIKKRIFLRTLNTFFKLDIVYLIFRALFACFLSEIKVLRMETFNALQTIVKMQIILAFALLCYCVVFSTIVTILTLEVCLVITLVWSTFNASVTIEERFLSWAKDTSF